MKSRKITVLTAFFLLFSLHTFAQHANENHWIEIIVKENATIEEIFIWGQKETTPITIKSGDNVLNISVPQFLDNQPEETEAIQFTASGNSIKIFGDITAFLCEGNKEKVIEITTKNNPILKALGCMDNNLTSLDLSQNIALRMLYFSENRIAEIDLSKNTALELFECDNNNLSSLDLSHNLALRKASCDDNKITSLDLSNNINLTRISCTKNEMESLLLPNSPTFHNLYCQDNKLTTLDLTKCSGLTFFNCTNNLLEEIHLKDNKNLEGFLIFGNRLNACALDSIYRNLQRKAPHITHSFWMCNSNLAANKDNPGRYKSNHTIARNNGWNPIDNSGRPVNNTAFDCELSIFDAIQNTTIANIYPNPVRDRLHVEANDPVSQIEIYDLTGKLILSKTIENESSFNIELSSLNTGNYIIKLTSKNGITTQKIIKE